MWPLVSRAYTAVEMLPSPFSNDAAEAMRTLLAQPSTLGLDYIHSQQHRTGKAPSPHLRISPTPQSICRMSELLSQPTGISSATTSGLFCYAFRLQPGQELKAALAEFTSTKKIKARRWGLLGCVYDTRALFFFSCARRIGEFCFVASLLVC